MHRKFDKSETQVNTNNSFPKTKQQYFKTQNEHAHIFNHSSLFLTTTVFLTSHHPSFDWLKTTYVYNEFNQLNSQSQGWQRELEDLSAQQSALHQGYGQLLVELYQDQHHLSQQVLFFVSSPNISLHFSHYSFPMHETLLRAFIFCNVQTTPFTVFDGYTRNEQTTQDEAVSAHHIK